MEHQVYPCSWKREKGQYRVFVKARPSVEFIAASFEEAVEGLQGRICEVFGDGEAVVEFSSPAPIAKKSVNYFVPPLFALDGVDSVQECTDQAALFSDGACKCCGGGLGKRNRQSRAILAAPKCDVSFVRKAMPRCWVFSERIVSVLVASGFRRMDFRKVTIKSETSGSYYELVVEPSVPLVATKEPPRAPHGWECNNCGRKHFQAFHTSVPANVSDFLCRSDIKARNTKGFVAGGSFKRILCLPASTLQKLKGLPRVRGITATRVALLDEEEVDRSPKVKTLKRGDFA